MQNDIVKRVAEAIELAEMPDQYPLIVWLDDWQILDERCSSREQELQRIDEIIASITKTAISALRPELEEVREAALDLRHGLFQDVETVKILIDRQITTLDKLIGGGDE